MARTKTNEKPRPETEHACFKFQMYIQNFKTYNMCHLCSFILACSLWRIPARNPECMTKTNWTASMEFNKKHQYISILLMDSGKLIAAQTIPKCFSLIGNLWVSRRLPFTSKVTRCNLPPELTESGAFFLERNPLGSQPKLKTIALIGPCCSRKKKHVYGTGTFLKTCRFMYIYNIYYIVFIKRD